MKFNLQVYLLDQYYESLKFKIFQLFVQLHGQRVVLVETFNSILAIYFHA